MSVRQCDDEETKLLQLYFRNKTWHVSCERDEGKKSYWLNQFGLAFYTLTHKFTYAQHFKTTCCGNDAAVRGACSLVHLF